MRTKVVLLISIILLLDQGLKFWVKTHMIIGQEILFNNWFRLHFTENPGMAFGMVLPGFGGKLLLTAFRLGASIGGAWYISRLIRQKAYWGFIVACSLILAGAIGNLIDGTFYGLIFSNSYGVVAQLLPAGGGYGGILQGRVVDMLWVPVWHGFLPGWLPIWGGDYFEFFRPVFNIADASITSGVLSILLFQKYFFQEEKRSEDNNNITVPVEPNGAGMEAR